MKFIVLCILVSSSLSAWAGSHASTEAQAEGILTPSWRSAVGAHIQLEQPGLSKSIRNQLIRVIAGDAFAKHDLKRAEEILSKNKADHLFWGRLKYQQADYKGAITEFQLISRSSNEFLSSREELAWAYLEAGDMGGLRGLLTHVDTVLVPLDSRLESRVLSAIEYLKNCRYEDVKQEIEKFQSEMRPLVKKLDTATSEQKAASAVHPDFYTRQAAFVLKRLETDEASPSKIAQAKQILARENARTWDNTKTMTSEAILKMRFVKMELLSQLQWIQKLHNKPDVLAKNNQLASSDEVRTDAANGKMVFPVKDDVWVDELFNIRALTVSECASLQKRRGT